MTVAEHRPAQLAASTVILLAPLRIEALALRRGAPEARVVHTGMGADAAPETAGALVVAGFGGALAADVEPATIVVADEVAGPDGDVLECDASLADDLREAGLPVRVGRVATARRIVRRAARSRLAESGALAVDMESYWLRRAAGHRRFAVARVIVDTPGRELANPLATLHGGLVAARTLRNAAAWLAAWRPSTLDEPDRHE
jgi:4-hydroxy-3-methylbut-2-en-1-yl diphosphate reductase